MVPGSLTHISGDVLLCAGEFVANAVEAAPTREIRVRLSRDADGVLLEVWDPGDTMPKARPIVELTLDDLDLSEENWDDKGGWGLPIVATLAQDCGFTPHPRNGGKTVWARFK
jgi:anti-sigma regulatory factor (Ser/Thr protein kinase)